MHEALWAGVDLKVEYALFTIDGQPLFEAAQDYLAAARALVSEARTLALAVHGSNLLTPPLG